MEGMDNWILDTGYWITGYWITGYWIPDNWILVTG
jgi:hypothetical protein